MERKNVNLVIIIIMAMALIGLSGYLVYDKFITKTDVEEKENKVDNKLIQIDINDKIVDKAMKSVLFFVQDDSKLYSNAYFNFEMQSLNKKDLISIAFVMIEKEIYSACDEQERMTTITMNELNETLRKVLIKPSVITIDDIKNSFKESSFPAMKYEITGLNGIDYGVNIENDKLQVVSACGGQLGPDFSDFTISDTIKAEKNSTNLFIYQKIAFVRPTYEEDDYMYEHVSYDHYKEYGKTTKIETISEYDKDPNWELYDTYKYTFKIDNGNYYFVSVELVK